MPVESLAQYINAQAIAGVGRQEILKALVDAGWQVDEANRGLISLGVALTGTAHAVTARAPAPPVRVETPVPGAPQAPHYFREAERPIRAGSGFAWELLSFMIVMLTVIASFLAITSGLVKVPAYFNLASLFDATQSAPHS